MISTCSNCTVTHQEGLDHQEREYMAQLFYFNHTLFSNEIYIHVVVTWNDETHLTVSCDLFNECA